MVRSLNRVIDIGWLPTKEAILSQEKNRAIGLGIQAFYDMLMLLRLPFDSKETAALNLRIFEAMYFAACEASCELAMKEGKYPTFDGSPMSEGKFQFDLWREYPEGEFDWSRVPLDAHDWTGLRAKVMEHGMRNSLLLALMPTASTSQMLGNYESFEPPKSLLSLRRTLAGEFVVVSKYLQDDLLAAGLWSEAMRDKIIANKGSVQGLKDVPAELQALHKTVWDINQKVIVDLCSDRGVFIDHSQSMNVFMTDINDSKIATILNYGYKKKGIKTMLYYLRGQNAKEAEPVTVAPEVYEQVERERQAQQATVTTGHASETSASKRTKPEATDEHEPSRKRARMREAELCSLQNKEACVSCGG